MSKLTKHQRDERKSLVTTATIRRLTSKETSAFIYEELGVSISKEYIRHVRMQIKRDCAKELFLLQKDREYYLQRMFFDRVDEFEYQQKVLHGISATIIRFLIGKGTLSSFPSAIGLMYFNPWLSKISFPPVVDSKYLTKDIAPSKLLTVASGIVTEKYIGSP